MFSGPSIRTKSIKALVKKELIKNISDLQKIPTLLKHEHLVKGIINSIEKGVLHKGDKLPSINQMVDAIGYARKTIVNAYEELKSRGIVESKSFKGYYIASEQTDKLLKIALVLFEFQSIQEDFYHGFRDRLELAVELDVFFHHNNVEIFETILARIEHKYGFYVIAPIEDIRMKPMLRAFPPEKLLIVDRHLYLGKEYSYITQNFEKAIYERLTELLPSIKKFKELIFLYNKESFVPMKAIRGFEKFLKDHDIKGSVLDSYQKKTVSPGSAYLVMTDAFLWKLLKECKSHQIKIGEDIGIISHDDSLLKEMISGGITTISTDFSLMGKMAAEHINQRKKIQITLPTKLYKRTSI